MRTVENMQKTAKGSWSPSQAAKCLAFLRSVYPSNGDALFDPTYTFSHASSVEEAYERSVDILNVGQVVTASQVADAVQGNDRRALSQEVNAVVVSPDIHTTVIAAASTLTTEDLRNATMDEFGFTECFILFPSPVWYTSPGFPHVNEVSALSVSLRRSRIATVEDANKIVPSLSITRWQDMQTIHPQDRSLSGARPKYIGLIPDGSATVPVTGGLTLDPRVRAEYKYLIPANPGDTSTVSANDIRDDVDLSWGHRYFYALSRLLSMRVADSDKQTHMVTQRAGGVGRKTQVDVPVNVISLSKSRGSASRSDYDGGTGAFTCRWVVRMHKVRQWYPKEGVHKIIWRGPYLKGPEDAPLKAPSTTAITP